MEYRKLGKLNVSCSLLGFGCMRFPLLEGAEDSKAVDFDKAQEMVRYSIDHGVNYIDTAYPYHGGESETIVGKILKDGYREKVFLATKAPSWKIEKYEDFEFFLDEQLQKLQTDYIDFYLLHSLSKRSWPKIKDFGALEFLDEMKKKGKIRFAGFSFHDQLPLFKKIIDVYPWDFTQIQLNYMDEEYQAGLAGMEYAAQKNIPVIVMEPLRGGSIVKNIPPEVKKTWAEADIKRSAAEWALRYVSNYSEVSVILSGMSHLDEVKENIKVLSAAPPNSLTSQELDLIRKVRDIYRDKIKIQCTNCEYCMPCPENVAITRIFEYYNDAYMYDRTKALNNFYRQLKENGMDVDNCVECGECESSCPQNLEIISLLKRIHEEVDVGE